MMKPQDAKKEIKKLSKEIERHNRRYYNKDQPTVSDREYDLLMQRLINLEEQFPQEKDAASPTQRVGIKAAAGSKTVTHRAKMYSLDNTYSFEELKEWGRRVEKGLDGKKVQYVCELKIDGVSASLTYVGGTLVLGATRGDGKTGENVTHNLRTIRSIPLSIQVPPTNHVPHVLEVRTEIYMDRKSFDQLNHDRKANADVLFVNPRNATSGSVKLLDSRITAQRNLNCFVHSFGVLEGAENFKTHWEFLQKVREWGF